MWAVSSPSLLAPKPFGPASGAAVVPATCLPTQAIDPRHLAEHMRAADDHRVGKYFERLIVYWLRYVRRLEVLSVGEVVRQAGRTKGEIDILFNDELGRMTHWELAVKFYLFVDELEHARRYVGPNPTDRLDKKVSKLFDHQLRLGREHHPEVQIQQALMKGRIFYPVNPGKPGVADKELPEFLAEDHLQGRWLRASEAAALLPQKSYFRVLRKPFWLSTELSRQPEELCECNAMRHALDAHFCQKNPRPILLAKMDYCANVWKESERFFIVSDHWPNL
ncbi:MAG: DUF1853 family protein [bacterium]|nr:DUF1853 family protein [bacterium]